MKTRVVDRLRSTGLAAALLASPVFAADRATVPDPNAPLMKRSEAILERALGEPEPDWARPRITERQRQWARRILEMTDLKLEQGGPAAAAARAMFPEASEHLSAESGLDARRPGSPARAESQPDTVRVFLTLGEDEAGRRRFESQLRALAGQKNVEVVLRGLPHGMRRIGELIGLLADIARNIDGAPPVQLDPKRFRQADIEAAPTVVLYRDGEALARLSGSLELGYLRDQVADGQRGMLGARGQVYPLAERDLMSVIRERWAKIDWKATKAQALADYWNAYTPTALPQASEPRVTTVDPGIIVARTIRAPSGQVIARKGERINPLAVVPFTGAVIAFDGASPKQVRLAGILAERARTDGLRAILLTQGMPGGEPGFASLERLKRELGARVYLLDARVIQRFDIEALPAATRARGRVFETREFDPDDALSRFIDAGDERLANKEGAR